MKLPIEQIRVLLAEARSGNRRRLVVVSGAEPWCHELTTEIIHQAPLPECRWIGGQAPEGLQASPPGRPVGWLGGESSHLVYDAFSGFDPNLFGAASGTLRGGGLLLLLAPPLDEWRNYPDPQQARIRVAGFEDQPLAGRFLQRLAEIIREDSASLILQQDHPMPPLPVPLPASPSAAPNDPECRTQDQAEAVGAIQHCMTGHRRRPVVLISDRGRGKSAALGIAAARLLLGDSCSEISVTAPRLGACDALFQQAARLLPDAEVGRGTIHDQQGRIQFAAPDELIHSPRKTSLLLVDEAAAIPTPLLEQLLERYPRIAFATTIHGYEGNGRGFAVRFRQHLSERCPQWREIHLEQPIRWSPDDPLERFLFRALALDATPAKIAVPPQGREQALQFEWLERDQLIADRQSLTDLFGLLVLAHYRTSPLDLYQLLDGPNLQIAVARQQGRIIATALVALEGGFSAEMAEAIRLGERRPRGHLLAQSLSAHLGMQQGACLRGARIMRIAVHPKLQRRGIGSRLLGLAGEMANEQRLDYLGASFGATPELLQFWQQRSFSPLRIGLRRGASSGSHSLLVVQPISSEGRQILQLAHRRFHQQLPQMLGDPLRELDPTLALQLLSCPPARPAIALDPQDWLDLQAFAFARRGFEITLPPIHRLTLQGLRDGAPLAVEMERLLLVKAVQHHSWAETASRCGFSGRRQTEAALREAVRALMHHYSDVRPASTGE
ncbi:tRNA(Met) cytidine acetyltransferase TmcA [Candidatus Endoriftia persephonae]|jgi:tRNA(Met) cytidine acetyltransferase|uniref:tRNA(Met) cytidine acetyltransferase TmcA n=2 Tax=Gammaproteobacteria TaxID=1236 RepID=G2FDA5_9GAMM|nr:GNAT family N-acetyltransferase [Candidatus Endoriftia persephone]EGW55191.1 uncharacterized protein YpfI [endosymbiont of Tevnia jerichonana (vent Tica)]USF88719.1 GNAT family N-acetyltransferase [Candidatus Endoriftia persephone]